MISYRPGKDFDLPTLVDLLRSCSLGARRPVDDERRLTLMMQHANLVFTAWDGPQMVGFSRSLSDFTFCTYLSDLAVRETHQRHGIGKELMRMTQDAAPEAMLILLAAPAAVDYYPKVGFTRHESAWTLKAGESLH
jgi:ribosomal protein S18 acetylase RimI-like enzyme